VQRREIIAAFELIYNSRSISDGEAGERREIRLQHRRERECQCSSLLD